MTIDSMLLSPTEEKDLIQDERNYGKDWAERRARYYKVRQYVGHFLDCERISSKRPFNCYVEGVDSYKRKDGGPLTEEDIRAVLESSPGQGTKVKGNPGDMQVLHEWCVDSSD